MRKCSVEGCARPHYGKDLCNFHYLRQYRGKAVETPGHFPGRGLAARLLEKIEYDTNGGCWLWAGAIKSDGYGIINFGRRGVGNLLAHRASWLIHKGSLPPKDLDLDHLCRVRCCVNPTHLEPVTRAVNLKRGYDARVREEATP